MHIVKWQSDNLVSFVREDYRVSRSFSATSEPLARNAAASFFAAATEEV